MTRQQLENLDFLYRAFRDLCLSGKLTDGLVGAFHRVLDHIGVPNSYEYMEGFFAETKEAARNALGDKIPLDFLDFDLAPDISTNIDIEDAYACIWQAAQRSQAGTLAAIRLSMIRSLGEDRQRVLIGQWV